ncbi:MAG: ParB/RepB/Spo0J family partition protein [Oscillospiraceae bacterium]|nr:ParB/RepB/Spo0J family partition protein [Oscillospiraceae bacterium]
MLAKKGLGSGLDALFGGDLPPEEENLRSLPISKIEPSEHQPRESFDGEKLETLADSIRSHGIIQPITVRRLEGDHYQIIAGERRWRAARMAGLSELPARIVDADDREAMVLALVENLQREDLNPVEQAKGLRRLLEEYGCTQEGAAELVGCSRPALTNALRLLALPEPVLAMLEDGRLSAGHGRALLALGDEKRIQGAAEAVLRDQLSVRQTEALVRKLLSPPKQAETKKDDIYVKALEERLTRSFNRKVHIVSGPRKGRLEIEYYGNEDLDALIAALGLPAGDGEAEDNA